MKDETLRELGRSLPDHWSRGNTIDILGDAGVDRYRAAIRACVTDAAVDALLVMLTPQAMTQPSAVAKALIEEAPNLRGKPILA